MRNSPIHRQLLSVSVAAIALVATAPGPATGMASLTVRQDFDTAAVCERLTGQSIGGARIERAEPIASGTKLPPFPTPITTAICRVDARIAPEPGSEIRIQLWLPQRWNGKFVGIGGGGFSGGLASGGVELTRLAEQGYAAVATDAGHPVSTQATWALGNPQKIVDFAHRANHLGAIAGKAIVADHYGRKADRSLFSGCSNGGRDALMLAQRYPADYDAIVAGAPANNWTGLMSWFGRHEQIARLAPGADLLGPKLKLIHDAAIAQCDKLDGVADNLIERPNQCRFDPGVLQCKTGAGSSCLTAPEVTAVRALYREVRTSDGRLVLPGLSVGSEYQWGFWVTATRAAGGDFAQQFFRYMVHDDPAWDMARFDLDRDYPLARTKMGPVLDAVDPDLRPFLRRGGRLLMYHGWGDAAIPAGNSINYFGAMRRATGRLGAERTRLFMLPGVGHCAGGNGPSLVDYLDMLDRWADSGKAPERIVAVSSNDPLGFLARKPVPILASRPACAWPKTAHYAGRGPVDREGSFVCR